MPSGVHGVLYSANRRRAVGVCRINSVCLNLSISGVVSGFRRRRSLCGELVFDWLESGVKSVFVAMSVCVEFSGGRGVLLLVCRGFKC